MRNWEDIAKDVEQGIRLSAEDALVLWQDAPLWRLGELAVARKCAVSGDKVYYNRNFHIEPTNLCVFNCKFCSFRRTKGSPEAWDKSMEEIEAQVRAYEGRGVTEVHIVGGVHPEHDIYYYCDMISSERFHWRFVANETLRWKFACGEFRIIVNCNFKR